MRARVTLRALQTCRPRRTGGARRPSRARRSRGPLRARVTLHALWTCRPRRTGGARRPCCPRRTRWALRAGRRRQRHAQSHRPECEYTAIVGRAERVGRDTEIIQIQRWERHRVPSHHHVAVEEPSGRQRHERTGGRAGQCRGTPPELVERDDTVAARINLRHRIRREVGLREQLRRRQRAASVAAGDENVRTAIGCHDDRRGRARAPVVHAEGPIEGARCGVEHFDADVSVRVRIGPGNQHQP